MNAPARKPPERRRYHVQQLRDPDSTRTISLMLGDDVLVGIHLWRGRQCVARTYLELADVDGVLRGIQIIRSGPRERIELVRRFILGGRKRLVIAVKPPARGGLPAGLRIAVSDAEFSEHCSSSTFMADPNELAALEFACRRAREVDAERKGHR